MYLQWFHVPSIQLSTLLACIPVVATVVTCILSLVLARATLRYAEATDKSLALAREEYEREWSPELHIKLERVSSSEAKIVITNLAKISVLLQLVQLRRPSQGVPFGRYFLNDPLVGGMTWTDKIGQRLVAGMGDDFEGQISASVTFYASGRLFRTDWFRFQIKISDGNIQRLEPVNIAARRVQVLEKKDTPEEFRRELVRDVAGDLVESGANGNS
ncbi:MAG: hypothetical protein DMG70_19270 [Acidobacteria bacterium]|nr:MAG: hypothetical protein DMG70_19270 [Acidobacteriota bacterium]PYY09306.1 MAG: hypothetical protein DMG69_10935 [Acidobacteriota bacterium]